MTAGAENNSSSAAADQLARHILEVAEEVEREELRIKHALLHEAESGRMDEVRRIVDRWLRVPVAEVLRGESDGDWEHADTRESTAAERPKRRYLRGSGP